VKNAHVLSWGCPENLFDAARVKLHLRENGWHIVNKPADADLVLFNACGLRQQSVGYSLGIINWLKRKVRSDTQIIIWGCLTKINPNTLKQVYNGPTFSEAELERLDSIINAQKPISAVTCNEIMPPYHHTVFGLWETIYKLPELLFDRYYYYRCNRGRDVEIIKPEDHSIFYIKIATGCVQHCSFCVSCLSRGRIKSKPISNVVDEFKEGLRQGYANFSLLGTDTGSYGKDLGCNLADLLREMIKEKGQYRIGLRNTYPGALKKMLDELKPMLSTGKIWYIEIAAESGSDRVLALMKRGYTVEDLKECVRNIRQAWPKIVIRTQFITGFPTETGRDFAQSMRLLENLRFDVVEVYQFSPMPGTLAEKMNQVPSIIAKYRKYRMLTKALRQSVTK